MTSGLDQSPWVLTGVVPKNRAADLCGGGRNGVGGVVCQNEQIRGRRRRRNPRYKRNAKENKKKPENSSKAALRWLERRGKY